MASQKKGFESDLTRQEVATLLDPVDVQRVLKLSSRRGARDLIVREMEHVVVGRTPMTTAAWLTQWLERQRRSPRQQVAPRQPALRQVQAEPSGSVQRFATTIPTPRRRAKDP